MKIKIGIAVAELNESKAKEELRRLVDEVSVSLEAEIVQMIREGGQPYLPNAPATIKRKGSSHPLIDTGEMMRRTQTDRGPNHNTVTVDVPYAVHNEYGAPERGIPKRPFVWPAINRTISKYRDKGVSIHIAPVSR